MSTFDFINVIIMKIIIAIVLILLSIPTQAQDDIFDQKKSQIHKDQDIMNFIKSDIDLYNHYQSGKKNLRSAKVLGYTTVGFLAIDAIIVVGAIGSSGYDALGLILLAGATITITAILGTIALILQAKGKSKINDVTNYAKGEIEYGGGFNIQSTSNGVGLVYSF